MRRIVDTIDRFSQFTGLVFRWLSLALVLVLVYEVIMRYLFNAPTIWAHMLSSMLGGAIAALGWAYTHRTQGHVRVDVFYSKYPPRVKAIVDAACWLVVFVPLLGFLIWQAGKATSFAIRMHEVMIESYWYPPAWPIKMVVLIGLCLFAVQGLSQFLKDAYFAVKGKSLD